MKTTTELIGQRIKQERERLKLSQTALAHKIGLNEEYKSEMRGIVSRWELGKVKPSAEYLVKLCELFGCEIGYLFGEINEPTRATTDITAASKLDARAVDVVINGARGTNKNPLKLSQPDFDRLFRKGLNSIIADCPEIAVIVAAYVFGGGTELYSLEKITIDGGTIPFMLRDIALRGGLVQEAQRLLEQYRWTVAGNGGMAPLDGVEKANAEIAAGQAKLDACSPHIGHKPDKAKLAEAAKQYKQRGNGNNGDSKK